jgi:hypothetical protein
LEAQVGAGGCQALLQGAVVGGELAHALLEGGVLRGDPLDGFFSSFGLQVADLTEEFADAGALGEDLGVGGFEGVLGVEGPLPRSHRGLRNWHSQQGREPQRPAERGTVSAAHGVPGGVGVSALLCVAMASLQEIRHTVAESDPTSWNRLLGWGGNSAPVTPAFVNGTSLTDHGDVETWEVRNYSDVLVLEDDVALSIGFGLPSSTDTALTKRTFPWSEDRGWAVDLAIADVRWHGAPVDRVFYWIIENDYACPIGEGSPGDVPRTVTKYRFAITEVINAVHGVRSERQTYFDATGQVVR